MSDRDRPEDTAPFSLLGTHLMTTCFGTEQQVEHVVAEVRSRLATESHAQFRMIDGAFRRLVGAVLGSAPTEEVLETLVRDIARSFPNTASIDIEHVRAAVFASAGYGVWPVKKPVANWVSLTTAFVAIVKGLDVAPIEVSRVILGAEADCSAGQIELTAL